MTTDELKQMIQTGLEGSEVFVEDLTGGGDHFHVHVYYSGFEGKNTVQQHQLVYKTIGHHMGNAVHALSIKTIKSKEEWDQEFPA